MPKTLQKVTKHISKKRGVVEALHENSRDAKRLRRATARDDRVARVHTNLSRGRQTYGETRPFFLASLNAANILLVVDRIRYFQENIPEDSEPFSDKDMMDVAARLVDRSATTGMYINASSLRYINRSVPEIEQLQSERRKGRPPSKREEALLQRTDVESREFKTGFWMPDISQQDVIKKLASWNGDWSGLSTMTFIRLTKEGEKQPSVFPPKGMS